jgi:penicillin-binding protein 1A
MARTSTRRPAPPPPRRRGRGVLTLFAILLVWGGIAACGFLIYASRDLPSLAGLESPERAPSVTYLDRHGSLIGRRGDQQGRAMRLAEMPAYLPAAVLAVEDRKFYLHPGVDPFGIARAAVANLRAGSVVQGGSTITQQLAKNLFLTNERTFRRKAQEVVLALWLEQKFSKDEILELYLNRVYFGSGAWGVEAASRRYFGKPASEVNLGEAALLAGLLKAPSRYNPSSDVGRAEARATVVLDVMVDARKITPAERDEAFAAPIVVARSAGAASAWYFMDWMDVQLAETIGRVERDLVVETTLDLGLQRAAEAALKSHLGADAAAAGATEGAAVALDPDGGVMAMAGGRSYDISQFNRITQARRQPGSSFKPFVYLAAIEAGFTPDTIVTDAPVRWGDYAPANYNNEYEGEITLRRAFERSSNSVAVRLAQSVGLSAVSAAARRMGITSALRQEAAMALGAQEVTPLELAAAYAPFANGGAGVFPHGVLRIRTPDGEILYERRGSGPGRAIDPRTLATMTGMMRGVVASGTGRRAALPGRDVGGKTGTTDNFRDAWFTGFADGVTGLVWVGNDDFRPMTNITGGTLPAEIWADFMAPAPSFRIAAPAQAGLPPAAPVLPAAAVRQAPPSDDPLGALIARVAE